MTLAPLDIAIIGLYLVLVIIAGFWLARHAGENMENYFLGGNKVPWYLLGVSNASSQFDITGTMWIVSLLFMCGVKGIWIPWLWPTFNQIFLMIFLSIWIRRSNVLTGAEWITTRFGNSLGAELSRLSVTFFALVAVIAFLSYAFVGIGKFAAALLPWAWGAQTYAMIFMGVTTLYVLAGGMYSVVLTDLVQFVLLTIASVAIAIIAILKVSPAMIQAATPAGWDQLFFGWRLGVDWSQTFPAIQEKIAKDGYSLFGIFFMMMLFKGWLQSLAGPAPNYDMQRILAAKTPKESALMSGIVSVALSPRWLMMTGIAVLALVFFQPQLKTMGGGMDLEKILPEVIHHYLPMGVKGVLLAGLFAAFMSTFDSTVNAGAAYLVNDVYKRYFAKDKSHRHYMLASYTASLAVVVVGVVVGTRLESIDQITKWIVSGLYGGYAAANLLKWYWWRFNGFGYFAGMLTGTLVALQAEAWFPNLSALQAFPINLGISLVVCVVVSLLTQPDDEATLQSFYKQVRPWGLWGPIREKVMAEDASFQPNTNFGRDMLNVVVGIVWQTAIVLVPVYLVLQKWTAMIATAVVVGLTTIFLKVNWYNRLEEQ